MWHTRKHYESYFEIFSKVKSWETITQWIIVLFQIDHIWLGYMFFSPSPYPSILNNVPHHHHRSHSNNMWHFSDPHLIFKNNSYIINIVWIWKLILGPFTFNQFHQHFTGSFLYKRVLPSFSLLTVWLWIFWQKNISAKVARFGFEFFGKRISVQKLPVKCWWNWLYVVFLEFAIIIFLIIENSMTSISVFSLKKIKTFCRNFGI